MSRLSKLERIVESQLDNIREELENSVKKGVLPEYVAAIAFGSATTPEVTKKSDIDIEVLYPQDTIEQLPIEDKLTRDKQVLTKKELSERLDMIAKKMTFILNREVHFWPKTLESYLAPGPFSSTPTEDVLALDGWDGMDSNGLRLYVKQTGRTVSGDKTVLDRMWVPDKLTARDAYERFAASAMYFARGIGGESNSLAKAILHAQSARAELETGHLPTLCEDIVVSAKGSPQESLVREAYATKIIANKGLIPRIKHLIKYHEWPRKKISIKKNDSIIEYFVNTKEVIANSVDKNDGASLIREEIHRERTAFKVVEALFANGAPHDSLFYVFGKEIVGYHTDTTLEMEEKCDLNRTLDISTPIGKAFFHHYDIIQQKTKKTTLDIILLRDFLLPLVIAGGIDKPEAEQFFKKVSDEYSTHPLLCDALRKERKEFLLRYDIGKAEEEALACLYENPENIEAIKYVYRANSRLKNIGSERDMSREMARKIITADATDVSTLLALSQWCSFEEANDLIHSAERIRPNYYRTYTLRAHNWAKLLDMRNEKSIPAGNTREQVIDMIRECAAKSIQLLTSNYGVSSWKLDRNFIRSNYITPANIFSNAVTNFYDNTIGPTIVPSATLSLQFALKVIQTIEATPEFVQSFNPRMTQKNDTDEKRKDIPVALETKARLYEIVAAAMRMLTPKNRELEHINFTIVRQYLNAAFQTWVSSGYKRRAFYTGYQEVQLLLREDKTEEAMTLVEKLEHIVPAQGEIRNGRRMIMFANLELTKSKIYHWRGQQEKANDSLENVCQYLQSGPDLKFFSNTLNTVQTLKELFIYGSDISFDNYRKQG